MLTLVTTLLLLGAGCGDAGRAPVAARELLPPSFVVMDGMEPRDESAWNVSTVGPRTRLEASWQTDARFDEVVAFYEEKYKADGLAVHRVENDQGVRVYWGLLESVRFAKPETHDYVFAEKRRVDGKTVVRAALTTQK